MKKPIIGIVSKPNKFDIKLLQNQIIYEPVRCAILKNGGLAIGILPTQETDKFYEGEVRVDKTVLTDAEKNDLYKLIDMCDGIILEGGLSSASYEYEVAKYAIEKNIPLLGICAGFNNIIRASGGNVFQDKNNKRHNLEDGSIAHRNKIIENTLLYNILQKSDIEVNSLHTFFAKDENIKNLEISAYSDDGYVEAVELKNKRFCLGVKWHPELMTNNEDMNRIFEYFIKACKSR
ncbi:MAG: gamma-glutamyl-gamma-aminobutyrate hydrolase family protein [Bacilli bacterium]|nr:gamma-glutamyl-gamma-aminobutyrate hydrolase family protein [Bacilli bacterium]